MIKPSQKRALSLFASALLLLGACVAYAIFVRPSYAAVTALRGELIAKQKVFEEKKAAVSKVESLIRQYQGAGKLQDVISMSLPQDEEVSSVFNQLQAIAGANGLSLQVFNVQQLPLRESDDGTAGVSRAKLVRPVGTLRLSLRLVGGYEAFKGFIRGLETNIRAMDATSVKVESAGRDGAYAFTVVADAYYQGK